MNYTSANYSHFSVKLITIIVLLLTDLDASFSFSHCTERRKSTLL